LEKISPQIFIRNETTFFLNKYKNFSTIPEIRESCTFASQYIAARSSHPSSPKGRWDFNLRGMVLMSKRYISTKNISDATSASCEAHKLNPIAYYSNTYIMKKDILQENKGKSGVYR
jgi:hypothetical protein